MVGNRRKILSVRWDRETISILSERHASKPQRALEGRLRKIVGFRLDQNLDWVATLECGHQIHVRQNPPFTEQHWVTTNEGRQNHIGHELRCLACK